MTTKITNYKALTFDCYGTLIDWESGIWDAMQPLLLLNNVTIDRTQGLEAFAIRSVRTTLARVSGLCRCTSTIKKTL